jgi:hypothetical protein
MKKEGCRAITTLFGGLSVRLFIRKQMKFNFCIKSRTLVLCDFPVQDLDKIGHMKSISTLNKPNVSLVMMPKAGKLTAIERKLLNSILLSSARQLREYRALHSQDPSNTHLYSALADELLDPVEVGKSNLKSALRKHVLALRRAVIDWEAPDAKSGVVWENLSMLSEARFEIRNGGLYVLWALPPKINEALSDYQEFHFTKLDLEKISRLKSYTAVALYEICARYKNNFRKEGKGERITNASPPEWWVDALTNIVPKTNKETGQPLRREWRKVKNEAVKKAIEEINAVTDLEIVLTEKKTGKAVSLVQFEIRLKKPEPREIQSSHFELIKSGICLGLTETQISSGIERTSVEQVGLGLAKLEARIKHQELEPVGNVGRYFNSIINDGAPVKVISDAEIERKPAPSLTTDTPVDQQKSVLTLAREEFMTLPEVEKRGFAARALEVLVARGVVTSRIQRNAEEGVWSGVLLSQMIEIFSGEKSIKFVPSAGA